MGNSRTQLPILINKDVYKRKEYKCGYKKGRIGNRIQKEYTWDST